MPSMLLFLATKLYLLAALAHLSLAATARLLRPEKLSPPISFVQSCDPYQHEPDAQQRPNRSQAGTWAGDHG